MTIPDDQTIWHVVAGIAASYSKVAFIGFIGYQMIEYASGREPFSETREDLFEFGAAYSMAHAVRYQFRDHPDQKEK